MKKGKARSRVRRTFRSIGAVFDKDFFEKTLPVMVETLPKQDGAKPAVTVYLGDGSQLDCCGIVALEERYGVLAAYEGVGADGVPRTADDVGFEAVPYELVLRVSVRAAPRPARLGFGEMPKS